MTRRHQTRDGVPLSNILNFVRKDAGESGGSAGQHDTLAEQEIQLREALAKVQALRRLKTDSGRTGGEIVARRSLDGTRRRSASRA